MPVEDNLDVQPEVQEPARSFTMSQLGSILPAIFVVAVLIGSLAVAFITLDEDGSTGSVVSYTPESSIIGLFDAYNAGNARAMADLTIYYFSDQYELIVTEFDGEIEGDVIIVLETEVFYREDMTTGDQDNIQQYADILAGEYGIVIDDFCVVVYECDFDGDVDQGSMICYNVGGLWYVTLEDYFMEGPTLTPVGSWADLEATTQTSGRITFGSFASFSSAIAPSDIMIQIFADGGYIGSMMVFSDTAPAPQPMSSPVPATYFDYNPSAGQINSGDYITLNGLQPDTLYSFEVFYLPTGEFITMVGSSQFMTPP